MLPKKIIVLAQIHKIWQDIQCEFFLHTLFLTCRINHQPVLYCCKTFLKIIPALQLLIHCSFPNTYFTI